MFSQTQALENQLENAKKLLETREIARRLFQNNDFRKLILDEFMTKETVRLIGAAGDPNADEKAQRDMLSMAMAGGHLNRFFQTIDMLAQSAENDLPRIESALEEVRTEGEDD